MNRYKLLLICICSLISVCSCAEDNAKEIYAADIIKLLEKGNSVEIANKIILDELNFTDVKNFQILGAKQLQNVIETNVFFTNCIFMGDVKTTGSYNSSSIQTKFEDNLIFKNCDFRGNAIFDNSVVMGLVNFQQTKFRKTASFNNMAVWSKNTYFSEIEAENTFSMVYSLFYGNLYCLNASFQGNVSLQETTIDGKFSANNIKCAKKAEFDMLSVRGRAIFNYAEFLDISSFIQSRFYDDVEYLNVKFTKNPDFTKAYFFGKKIMDKETQSMLCDREYLENNK